ncbi:hypothetical protein ACFCXR_06730 [Streptomyces noursei]|uniref:hypothetical protein n=1 Tax=Streptomyces TaxID=1883 RepID=UPI001F2D3B04|nr:hypothetical protein [Streptomyces noursei]MCE4947148.1 hypothetical protein [Streptomyces noursei]
MRVRRRMAGAAGASVLVLMAVGCGGPAATPGPGASAERVTPAEPLPMVSAARAATWTGTDHTARPLRLKPTRLARGHPSDLAHIRLDDDLKGMVPYYLTVSYTNTGKAAVSQVYPERNFSLTGVDGKAGEQLSLFRTDPLATGNGLPPECQEAGKATLAAGETSAVCQIFMLPKGLKPGNVSYKDDGGDTLLWQIGGALQGAHGVLPAHRPADAVTTDSDRRTATVLATPKSVRPGSPADLSRYDLDADQKKLVPYFVTVVYRNTGTQDLLPSLNDSLTLTGVSGQRARKMIFLDIGGPGVPHCPEAVPHKMLKPGATVTECTVHMLPKGDPPASLTFQGSGDGAQPVTWRAAADDPQ